MGGDGSEPAAAAGVTALTVDSAVLNLFWELASVHSAKREARPLQRVWRTPACFSWQQLRGSKGIMMH